MYPERVFSCQEIKQLDKHTIEKIGIPGMVLMENAGLAVVHYLEAHLQQEYDKVLICCGKGNNAGDGLVVARHLWNHDYDVEVLLFEQPEDYSKDTYTNYLIAKNCQVPMHQVHEQSLKVIKKNILSNANWIVDALFGIGFQGHLQGVYSELVSAINQSNAQVLSIDVPSGLNADSGQALGICIQADVTLTFVGVKQGFLTSEAQHYLGELHVMDIGIPKIMVQQTNPNSKV